MMKKQLIIEEVKALGHEEFVAALGFLFEGSPWIAAEVWRARPFDTLTELHEALCNVMYNAPIEQKLALIMAHPDLVGKAALSGALTPASTSEQSSAGLDRLSPEEIALFNRLNRAYKDKFGFPFVICARENKKESILRGFETRLRNSRQEEIDIALDEIAKIARLRLLDVLSPDSGQQN